MDDARSVGHSGFILLLTTLFAGGGGERTGEPHSHNSSELPLKFFPNVPSVSVGPSKCRNFGLIDGVNDQKMLPP